MKEELFSKLLSYMDNIEGFVSQEIPDIFNQIIYYGMVSNIFHCIVFSLLMLFFYRCIKYINKEDSKIEPDIIPIISFFTLVGFIIFTFFLLLSLKNCIKVFIAPKLYLIDYLTGNLTK